MSSYLWACCVLSLCYLFFVKSHVNSLVNYYVQRFIVLCLLQTFDKTPLFVVILFVFIIWIFLYTLILHSLFQPAVFHKIFYFVISIPLFSFFFFLWLLAILYHVSVYIVVKAFRLPVLVVIVFELSNVHGCFSSTTSGSYFCLTDIIATVHFFNVSDVTIDGYPNIVLIILLLTFFFNKKITYIYISSVSVFMANALNSIMKSTIYFFLVWTFQPFIYCLLFGSCH